MGDVYFTSDLHIGHRLVASKRGFKSVEEHDAAVCASLMNLNKRDFLWVLGDIAWKEQHLHLLYGMVPCPMAAVLGNHDKLNTQVYLKFFTRCGGAVSKYNYLLTHVPVHPQEIRRWRFNIHGHIHYTGETDCIPGRYFNVNWDYHAGPVSLASIEEKYNRSPDGKLNPSERRCRPEGI